MGFRFSGCLLFLFVSISLLLYSGYASPKAMDEKTSKILEKELSDKEHYQQGVHNVEFDRDAFLGEEAKSFDQLSPEESSRRLGIIFDKIDTDSDGFVTQEELKDWIRYTQKKYVRDDIDRIWKTYNPENNEKLTWKQYSDQMYGFMKDMDQKELNKETEGMSHQGLFERERRRWQAADLDGDDALTKEEFGAFYHPEETPHMRDLVVLETLEDIDKNKDGKVSLKEYLGDMHKFEEGEEEPDWVQNEKQYFERYRDKDGDGFMDIEEIKSWIVPQDFDHAEAEARHLIYESDMDADQKLSKEEVLEKYDLFLGSQATDFGDVLLRHDEF